MKTRLVHEIPPKEGNPRNSEGSFLRAPNGDILFAYSAYTGKHWQDHEPCRIVMIRSTDEGETWSSEPVEIANAAFFGTKNVMSVSACPLLDGTPAFYFGIKEGNGSSTMGRAVMQPDGQFAVSRVKWNAPTAYYVKNNDRLTRLSDGRLVMPSASYSAYENLRGQWPYSPAVTVLLVSEDDGASFSLLPTARLSASHKINLEHGLQEPGIIELGKDLYWLWMRTGSSYQYESYSFDGLRTFTIPEPSIFTSPDSPMQIVREDENTLYAIYNPTPNYNGRKQTDWGWGRTPLVLRKSTDNGKTFGELNVIEDDENRGYCYPAAFFTRDGSMLCAYCRGGKEDGATLCRLGISKIDLSTVL